MGFIEENAIKWEWTLHLTQSNFTPTPMIKRIIFNKHYASYCLWFVILDRQWLKLATIYAETLYVLPHGMKTNSFIVAGRHSSNWGNWSIFLLQLETEYDTTRAQTSFSPDRLQPLLVLRKTTLAMRQYAPPLNFHSCSGFTKLLDWLFMLSACFDQIVIKRVLHQFKKQAGFRDTFAWHTTETSLGIVTCLI